MGNNFQMSGADEVGEDGNRRWLRLVLSRLKGGHDRRPESGDSLELGKWGERLAAQYLERHGFRLVTTNFSAPIGQRRDGRLVTGEIDIIAYEVAREDPVLVFVEVKTRSSAVVASPESAVNRRKQRQIARAARVYRRLLRVWDEPYRYDVVTVLAGGRQAAEVSLLRGYFDNGIFRGNGSTDHLH